MNKRTIKRFGALTFMFVLVMVLVVACSKGQTAQVVVPVDAEPTTEVTGMEGENLTASLSDDTSEETGEAAPEAVVPAEEMVPASELDAANEQIAELEAREPEVVTETVVETVEVEVPVEVEVEVLVEGTFNLLQVTALETNGRFIAGMVPLEPNMDAFPAEMRIPVEDGEDRVCLWGNPYVLEGPRLDELSDEVGALTDCVAFYLLPGQSYEAVWYYGMAEYLNGDLDADVVHSFWLQTLAFYRTTKLLPTFEGLAVWATPGVDITVTWGEGDDAVSCTGRSVELVPDVPMLISTSVPDGEVAGEYGVGAWGRLTENKDLPPECEAPMQFKEDNAEWLFNRRLHKEVCTQFSIVGLPQDYGDDDVIEYCGELGVDLTGVEADENLSLENALGDDFVDRVFEIPATLEAPEAEE